MAILGGTCFLMVILVLITFPRTDFDQRLIIAVENEQPTSILITQIEEEADKDRLKLKKNFESRIINQKYWFQPCNASTFEFASKVYYGGIKLIDEQEQLRKDFVRKKISKEEFIRRSKRFKKSLIFERL